MHNKYIGKIKKGERKGGYNWGEVWVRQPDGTYECDRRPGAVLSEDQIKADVRNGYLRPYN